MKHPITYTFRIDEKTKAALDVAAANNDVAPRVLVRELVAESLRQAGYLPDKTIRAAQMLAPAHVQA